MAKWKRMTIKPASMPNSDINVTPLVDVVLVLLIIFMVVTPLLEKDIEVKVPDTEKIENVTEMPSDQVIVSIDEEGKIKINADTIAEEDYVDKLKRIMAAKRAGEKLVFFMPHDKSNYGTLVTVLDGAKAAGTEILGMMTELPEGGLPNAQEGEESAPPEGAPTP